MTGPGDPTTRVPAVEGDLLGGRYELREVLGEGGMSRVHLGHDRDLDRPVAVKLLHSADPDDVARIGDEARAAAAVDHPGVVQVFDVGTAGEGVYLVMSLVEGETLARRVQRDGPLDPAEVVRIGVAVCDALGAAHRAGVVHRDVTPGNIVLGPDGRVTVTDFGIARLGEGAGRTRTGYVVGTPLHMAPEQGRAAGRVDGRADLYALACCLFTALTGRPPFTDPDAFTVVLAHLRDAPPRPSSLRAGIPPALEETLLWALAKDPDRRPPDAATLAAALASGSGRTAPVPPPRHGPGSTRQLPGGGHATGAAPHALHSALDDTLGDVEHDDAAAADRRRRIGLALIVLAALLVLGVLAAALLL
ncbi:serine/threonine-protein kinase [Pseudonocardia sp. NPDC049635]|uniref:serine/threonine-protein kinase n=1 Tax=Pseudonocardia sp. NPDC049635 TaxID=3155506 RepID=UPI0033E16679